MHEYCGRGIVNLAWVANPASSNQRYKTMGENTKPIENKYGVKVLAERPYYPGVWVLNCQFRELLLKITECEKDAFMGSDKRGKGLKTRSGHITTMLRIGDLLEGGRFIEITDEETKCLIELLTLLWSGNSGYEMVGDFGR